MNKFYVYIHKRKDTGEAFYVGKGYGKRAWSSRNRNPYWHNIAKDGYDVSIFATCLSEQTSFELEIMLIKQFKAEGLKLANMTEGGDGRSGYKWSKESIEKRTKSVLGKPRANKGFKMNQTQRDNLSKTMMGKTHKDSKKVIETESGMIFNSAKDAGLALSIPWGSLYKMLSGERPNTTTLKYLEN